jgi:hypothetical protein
MMTETGFATRGTEYNELQRKRLLVQDLRSPDGPMRSPSHDPQVRFLSLPEAIAAVEQLIASGGWRAGEKGLRLWQVARRFENVPTGRTLSMLTGMIGSVVRSPRLTGPSPRHGAGGFAAPRRREVSE